MKCYSVRLRPIVVSPGAKQPVADHAMDHAMVMAAMDGVIEWPKTGGLISKTLEAKSNRPLALHAVDWYFF